MEKGPVALDIKFIHPDLGIGGAERLIVDAACGLKRLGNEAVIYTSQYDASHSFEETKNGEIEVEVRGNSFFPSSLLGNRFRVICAWFRNLHLACNFWWENIEADVVVVDQVSACIPLLKVFGYKVLFYCHYPDKLLTGRETLLKAMYRYPIDKFEEWTTAQADKILVNSEFTLEVFKKAFPNINKIPKVLYPGIHTNNYDLKRKVNSDLDPTVIPLLSDKITILSINRFERKKNLGLAIRAFLEISHKPDVNDDLFSKMRLIIAGGYDKQNLENVEYLQELRVLCRSLGLKSEVYSGIMIKKRTQVIFLPSFNQAQRTYLLNNSRCLVYTPTGEHFGIVPLEAMYCKLPVVAVNSGGPKETIVHGETGYLTFPTPIDFSDYMKRLCKKPNLAHTLGSNGHQRVNDHFTSKEFETGLENILLELYYQPNNSNTSPEVWAYAILFFIIFFPLISLGFI